MTRAGLISATMPNPRVCACRKVETEKARVGAARAPSPDKPRALFPVAEPPLFLALCLLTFDPFPRPRDHVLRITGPSLQQRCTQRKFTANRQRLTSPFSSLFPSLASFFPQDQRYVEIGPNVAKSLIIYRNEQEGEIINVAFNFMC